MLPPLSLAPVASTARPPPFHCHLSKPGISLALWPPPTPLQPGTLKPKSSIASIVGVREELCHQSWRRAMVARARIVKQIPRSEIYKILALIIVYRIPSSNPTNKNHTMSSSRCLLSCPWKEKYCRSWDATDRCQHRPHRGPPDLPLLSSAPVIFKLAVGRCLSNRLELAINLNYCQIWISTMSLSCLFLPSDPSSLATIPNILICFAPTANVGQPLAIEPWFRRHRHYLTVHSLPVPSPTIAPPPPMIIPLSLTIFFSSPHNLTSPHPLPCWPNPEALN